MDNFVTLSNRLLNQCPAVGLILSQQYINDAWHELQSRREWSWRRRNIIFAPPNIYQTGLASSNVGAGLPFTLTGSGTAWDQSMVNRQIRLGGLLYPYYTIVDVDPVAQTITLDQPWAGQDVTAQAYQILQCYYAVPNDFGYFYVVVSIKDGYRLWTNVTENDLALLDPQRTNTGQTYAVVFRSYYAPVPVTTDPFSGALPLFELWPAPTYNGYLYPGLYIAKEYDLTVASPQLPPIIQNRGEVLLQMALEKCATFPGPDIDHPNPYFNLTLAKMHAAKAEQMLWDMERNDEEIGVTNVDYQKYPFYPAPWQDGGWQQTHAPFL